MENMREFFVVYEEADVAEYAVPAMTVAEESPARRRRKIGKRAIAALLSIALLLGAGYAAVQFGVPFARYHSGMKKLERGEYAEALEIFEQLGDYRDAPEKITEAEKGLVYLDAAALLERGDREGAIPLLMQIGDFLDAGDLLRHTESELLYEQAERSLAKGDYLSALDAFTALGTFRDAPGKAEECRGLYEKEESEKAYAEGCRLRSVGKLTEAYRAFASIPIPDYLDTAQRIDEIFATAATLAEKYAGIGERGCTLAFIDLAEKIDGEKDAALREKLITEEEFALDHSFYFFDTTHINRFWSGTQREEFATVVLYMLLHGEMYLALGANVAVDFDIIADRALQACDLVGEIIPGYGATYNPSVYVGDTYVAFKMDYDQEYTEHQRTQHIKGFKEFCQNSVLALAEVGLLSETMTRQQKAEVIMHWVGFYLTYDQTLKTHDVGVAIEGKRGVCESYAALYNRMCNLAGIPTYGQVGTAGSGTTSRHIWSFHVAEDGSVFYADATWADPYGLDFGMSSMGEPTIELFLEYYLADCMTEAMEKEMGTYLAGAPTDVYIWSAKRWLSHVPERSPEEIIAYHNTITGKK